MFFLFMIKTSRLNDLKTRAAMNAKISVFVICDEAIYLLLHNWHDCTLKNNALTEKLRVTSSAFASNINLSLKCNCRINTQLILKYILKV